MKADQQREFSPLVQAALNDLAGRYHRASFNAYPPLQAVWTYVERTLPEPVTLRSAVKAAGREYKYFSTYFRCKAGVTFTEWSQLIRLGRALELFEDWSRNITGIACDAGFGDLRTFERAFRRIFGDTPSRFRLQLRPESRTHARMQAGHGNGSEDLLKASTAGITTNAGKFTMNAEPTTASESILVLGMLGGPPNR